MIASTSNYWPGPHTGTYTYTICNYSYYLPTREEADPKRRIPFYRALFDQDFPPPLPPKKITPRLPKWSPHMGRVRTNHS